MAVHQLCPRPSPTACSYIWLSFSNLPSPTMLILLKSLLAVSILHLFIPKPSSFLSMWACYSLYWHTPFSHTQRAHLYSTTFYPRFSLCKTFIISILHLCPQSQQSEINFYPFSAKNVTFLRRLSNSLQHAARANKVHSPLQMGNLTCLLWPLFLSSCSKQMQRDAGRKKHRLLILSAFFFSAQKHTLRRTDHNSTSRKQP